MILTYLTSNFLTIMIIIALIIMMIVNRKLKIPATQYFYALIVVVMLLSVLDFVNAFLARELEQKPDFDPIFIRTVVDAISYMIRPIVIMIEVLVIQPKQKAKLFCVIPAVINSVWYSTALFGSKIAFYIDSDGWQGGVFHIQLVYVVQFLYVILLVVYSICYFGRGNTKTGTIIMIIVLAALLTAFLENRNILTGYATTVAAFCVLLYYIYLATVYQEEMSELFEEKELHIAQQELLLLRGQLHSEFIFDTLSVIRSLAKTDKTASAAAIDSFSSYLRAHLNAIRDDKPIAFQWEIDCVKAYLELLKIEKNRTVELISDLETSDFELPPLLLETVASYCIGEKAGNDEALVIQTFKENEQVRVCLTANADKTERAENASGLETARSRLEMQCDGTLETDGPTVTMIIPQKPVMA